MKTNANEIAKLIVADLEDAISTWKTDDKDELLAIAAGARKTTVVEEVEQLKFLADRVELSILFLENYVKTLAAKTKVAETTRDIHGMLGDNYARWNTAGRIGGYALVTESILMILEENK